ncbi:hypothetical protein [Bacillus sp. AK128]
MEKLKKMRFIEHRAIQSIDRILFVLSFGYLYLYFQYGYAIDMLSTIFIISIHGFNFLSKAKANSLFAAFGYSLLSFAILYYYYPNVGDMKLLFFLPFILFFVVLFSNFPSTLLTGFLVGFWVLLFYFAFTNGWSGIYTILASYANYNIVINHIYFLFMTAAIIYLFSKTKPYYGVTKTTKIAQLLVWLGIPFILVVINDSQPAEGIQIAGIYMLLAIVIYRSFIANKIILSSIAYAMVTFIGCTFIKEYFSIENFYFVLIAPLLILLLVNYYKMSVRFLIGFVFTYWFIQLLIFYKGLDNGVVITLEGIFSRDGIMSSIKYGWIPVIVGLFWSQKSSSINLIIQYLERTNRKIKQRKTVKMDRKPVHSQPVHPNTKGWEEL